MKRKKMRERRVNLYKIGVLCIEVMYIDIRVLFKWKNIVLATFPRL